MVSLEQIEQHRFYSKLLLLSSIPTYLFTRYIITAPFGKHVSSQSSSPWWHGPKVNARISWFLFECPNLIWSWYYCWYQCDESILYFDANSEFGTSIFQVINGDIRIATNALLVGLFTMHYANRAILYPLRMNRNSQPVPLVVILSAVLFTSLNGYIQCFFLGHIEKLPPVILSKSDKSMHTLFGIPLFFAGMGINIYSDGVLRNLRLQNKDKDTASNQRIYYIPRGALFTYVSCPNFAGEILEWFGFAITSHFSLASVAFLCYTASNLIPRGIAHHEWYKNKFDDYPVERKWAVIPFIA